jgi:plastocyanin
MYCWRRLAAGVLTSAMAAAAVPLASCGGGSESTYGAGPTTTPPTTNPGGSGVTTNSVVIADQSFSPSLITAPVGTTVTWQWKSCDDVSGGYGTCVSHNVTFDDGSNIASSTQSTGTFSRTFGAAGTYKYHCTIHGAGMSGQITVK